MLQLSVVLATVPTLGSFFGSIWAWLYTHPWTDIAVALWLITNIIHRPHPEELKTPAAKLFWLVVDRLCVLTAAKVPGNLKWLLVASPVPPSAPATDPPATPEAPPKDE